MGQSWEEAGPFPDHIFLVLEVRRGFLGVTSGEEPACQCRSHKRHGFDPWVGEISLEEGNPLRILAWRVPGTEKPSGLQSTGLQRVGND